MDNPSAPIPSISLQPVVQSEVSAPSQSPSHRWLLWLGGGLAVLAFGIAIGVFGVKFLNQAQNQSQISTYEDCLAAKGSIVQESYPAICATVSGQRFIQPVLSIPFPTPESAILSPDPTANWKTYTIEKFGIQFKLPEQLSTLGNLDIKECAGEKGMEFSATLPSNKSSGSLISIVYAGGGCSAHNLLSIGAVSSDYEAGRSRRFTDTNGYFSKTGIYFCVGPGAVRNDEIPSHLVKEIVSQSGVPLLRIMGEDESYGTWPKLCTPGSGKIGSLVNLSKNKTYPGIALQMDLTNQLSENLFDQILSTFKFTGIKPTVTPATNKNVTNFYYKLPDGWKTVQDETGSFEVGYDPNATTTSLTYSPDAISIFIKGNIGGAAMSVHLKNYEGGSRHQFIYKFTNDNQPPQKQDLGSDYNEKEYLYNNTSCLFLRGIYTSQFPNVWGMCDAGSGKAFLITSYVPEYETTLQTIRLLK